MTARVRVTGERQPNNIVRQKSDKNKKMTGMEAEILRIIYQLRMSRRIGGASCTISIQSCLARRWTCGWSHLRNGGMRFGDVDALHDHPDRAVRAQRHGWIRQDRLSFD